MRNITRQQLQVLADRYINDPEVRSRQMPFRGGSALDPVTLDGYVFIFMLRAAVREARAGRWLPLAILTFPLWRRLLERLFRNRD